MRPTRISCPFKIMIISDAANLNSIQLSLSRPQWTQPNHMTPSHMCRLFACRSIRVTTFICICCTIVVCFGTVIFYSNKSLGTESEKDRDREWDRERDRVKIGKSHINPAQRANPSPWGPPCRGVEMGGGREVRKEEAGRSFMHANNSDILVYMGQMYNRHTYRLWRVEREVVRDNVSTHV